MAWTVTPRWISPANWGGSAGTMQGRKARVIVTGTSDAATELTNQILIDISTLNTLRGDVCTQIAPTVIQYDISGLTSATLEFDHGTDDAFLTMGSGISIIKFDPPMSDTLTSSDGTGDLVLTTVGGAAGSRFTIDIEFNIK